MLDGGRDEDDSRTETLFRLDRDGLSARAELHASLPKRVGGCFEGADRELEREKDRATRFRKEAQDTSQVGVPRSLVEPEPRIANRGRRDRRERERLARDLGERLGDRGYPHVNRRDPHGSVRVYPWRGSPKGLRRAIPDQAKGQAQAREGEELVVDRPRRFDLQRASDRIRLRVQVL